MLDAIIIGLAVFLLFVAVIISVRRYRAAFRAKACFDKTTCQTTGIGKSGLNAFVICKRRWHRGLFSSFEIVEDGSGEVLAHTEERVSLFKRALLELGGYSLARYTLTIYNPSGETAAKVRARGFFSVPAFEVFDAEGCLVSRYVTVRDFSKSRLLGNGGELLAQQIKAERMTYRSVLASADGSILMSAERITGEGGQDPMYGFRVLVSRSIPPTSKLFYGVVLIPLFHDAIERDRKSIVANLGSGGG